MNTKNLVNTCQQEKCPMPFEVLQKKRNVVSFLACSLWLVRKVAPLTDKVDIKNLKTHGSHGPSGLDANEWRTLLTSFKSSSTDLCKTLAKLAVRMATSHLTFLLPYNSCRLIALNKCPGVRPIGIGGSPHYWKNLGQMR